MATYEERGKTRPLPDVAYPHIPSPYIRTPLTDVFGSIINHQQYSKCGPFELNMMECLEAYGLDQGRKKCSDYIDDFNECQDMTKQFLRIRVSIDAFISFLLNFKFILMSFLFF